MNIIVCVDNAFGMGFNGRRQSRDIVVIEQVIELTKYSTLWLNQYSKELFEEMDNSNINIDDNFLLEAANGEFCFVENKTLSPFWESIEKAIVFKWNRQYPSDFTLDIDLSKFKLTECSEFKGHSHEVITMEVYTK